LIEWEDETIDHPQPHAPSIHQNVCPLFWRHFQVEGQSLNCLHEANKVKKNLLKDAMFYYSYLFRIILANLNEN